jgi:cytoskeletal protein CcmA (bactofilin family)
MALWKDSVSSKPAVPPPVETATPARFDPAPTAELKPEPIADAAATRAPSPQSRSESLIAPDIAIEGKIEGSGHVRIAGRFKGDIDVRGDLTIESGAKVTGSVRADKVTIAGELVGNIEAATHVDLLKTGALTGDMKAASLSVAAGSRMRGQADFGWDDGRSADGARKPGNGKVQDRVATT